MDIDVNEIEPLNGYLLVKPIGGKTETDGGIALPNVSQEKPNRGVVMRTALGVDYVNEGDMVLFSKFGGNTIKLREEEYLWLKESDLYGVASPPYSDE